MNTKILITGAGGQVGTELSLALGHKYSNDAIIVSDIKELKTNFKSYLLDITDANRLQEIVSKENITQIYHLAAVLSAKAESIPLKAWYINMTGLLNVLEVAKVNKLEKVFYPSSIAVFGDSTPKICTPQHTINEPTTVYGISKYTGELWAQYYHQKYGLDVRGLRYPGIISYKTTPGGGTTDYAVDIFIHAIQGIQYTCYLDSNTVLPMMYMPDVIQATLQLMNVNATSITVRTAYNINGMTFTPAELHHSICKIKPNFEIHYQPDYRQKIAASWNHSLDDTKAKHDWGWTPHYDIDMMCTDMLAKLENSYLLK